MNIGRVIKHGKFLFLQLTEEDENHQAPLVLIEPQDVKLPYDDCNKAEAEFAIHENTVILPSGCDYRVNLRCANIFSFAGRKITPECLLPGEMV